MAANRFLSAEKAQVSDDRRLEPHPPLHISLFGGVSLGFRGRRVELNNRKAMGLVGYLALAPNLRETRERIVGLLWSETEEAKARATLRQVLRELRFVFDQCGFRGFSTERAEIGLEGSMISTDVAAVLESVAAGRPDDLLLDRERISETLLVGYEDADPSFRVWLLVARESLHRRLTRGLEDQLGDETRRGAETRRLAQALIQLDPTHEGGYQTLMRCHADAGDIAGALGAYKKLWDLLDHEYDMEPSEKSQKLVAAIKAGTYVASDGAAPVAAVPPTPLLAPGATGSLDATPVHAQAAAKLTLVVGGFDSEGVDPAKRHISLGFRYELISYLVRFREWTLIDASPVPGAARPAVDVPHYLITANLFQSHETVNVILTLQAGETGVVIWSERYSLALAEFQLTQQRILHGLATALNVHVSAERLMRISSAPDVSLDTYDRWLRAQGLLLLFQPFEHERIVKILDSVIEEAPRFAPAYCVRVQLENTWHIVFPGIYRTVARHQRALALAQTAVTLDPLDSRAHLCFAWVHAFLGQFESALAGFRQARTLNEYDPWTTTSAGLGLAYAGELDEARAFADHALELSPFATPLHWCYQGTIRLLCSDYAASVDCAERSGDAINYFLGWRAAAFAYVGQTERAQAEGRRFLAVIRRVWAGAAPPGDEEIVGWLLHCFPFRRPEGRDRLRQGLEAAGLPAPRAVDVPTHNAQ